MVSLYIGCYENWPTIHSAILQKGIYEIPLNFLALSLLL